MANEVIRRVDKGDIKPGTVVQRDIDANTAIIIFGLAANRPTIGGPTCLAYWAYDTGVLSIWNKQSWLTTTLS